MSDAGPRVVIADDDEDIRELVAFKLSNAGYEVRAARDGVEALEAITSFEPALAILDVMMPGLSGLDVLRRLRKGRVPQTAAPCCSPPGPATPRSTRGSPPVPTTT